MRRIQRTPQDIEEMTTHYRRLVRGSTRLPDGAAEEIVKGLVAAEMRGEQSCVWHEVYVWQQATDPDPKRLCYCNQPACVAARGGEVSRL